MSLPVSISGRAEADLTHQYRWYLDRQAEAVVFNDDIGAGAVHGTECPQRFRGKRADDFIWRANYDFPSRRLLRLAVIVRARPRSVSGRGIFFESGSAASRER